MTMFLSPIRNRRSLFSFSVPSRGSSARGGSRLSDPPCTTFLFSVRVLVSRSVPEKSNRFRRGPRRDERKPRKVVPILSVPAMRRVRATESNVPRSGRVSRRRRGQDSLFRHCFPCSHYLRPRTRNIFPVRFVAGYTAGPLCFARSPTLLVSRARYGRSIKRDHRASRSGACVPFQFPRKKNKRRIRKKIEHISLFYNWHFRSASL